MNAFCPYLNVIPVWMLLWSMSSREVSKACQWCYKTLSSHSRGVDRRGKRRRGRGDGAKWLFPTKLMKVSKVMSVRCCIAHSEWEKIEKQKERRLFHLRSSSQLPFSWQRFKQLDSGAHISTCSCSAWTSEQVKPHGEGKKNIKTWDGSDLVLCLSAVAFKPRLKSHQELYNNDWWLKTSSWTQVSLLENQHIDDSGPDLLPCLI